MEVTQQIRSSHRGLSPAADRFLDYVLAHPETCRPLDYRDADVPPWLQSYPFQMQSWPVLVGAAKLQQIAHATAALVQLVRSIPERVFDNDPRRISQYYGWGDEHLTALLLEPPSGLEGALTRCDFVDGETGWKCMEVNGSPNLGGWQHRFFEQVCRRNPAIAPFMAAEPGLHPVFRDPWHAAFSHVVNETRRAGIAGRGELNTVLMFTPTKDARQHQLSAEEQRHLGDLYAQVLAGAAPGFDGEVLLCTDYGQLTAQGTRLSARGRQVHAVLEYFATTLTPSHVYRCFKSGAVGLYNGPLAVLLSDKRNLALLSQLEESDRLSAAERAVVRDHVPWSREVEDCRSSFHGQQVQLLEFATAHRESLVLKPADGSSGREVYLGGATSPAEWSARLRSAAGGHRYLLQEYVLSRPFLFQHGAAGCAVHDLVWGTFCFGDRYGGGFVRMLPRERGPSVINSARGATEGIMFEI
jgi:hypothetical protein